MQIKRADKRGERWREVTYKSGFLAPGRVWCTNRWVEIHTHAKETLQWTDTLYTEGCPFLCCFVWLKGAVENPWFQQFRPRCRPRWLCALCSCPSSLSTPMLCNASRFVTLEISSKKLNTHLHVCGGGSLRSLFYFFLFFFCPRMCQNVWSSSIKRRCQSGGLPQLLLPVSVSALSTGNFLKKGGVIVSN